MDRLPRSFVACGLGLLMAAGGCRSTRNEVPPGRPFAKDGQQRKAIEFSSEGHPVSASASANFMPNGLGGSNLASGIGSSGGRPDGAALGGAPGAYGGPGTSGMPEPGVTDPSTTRATGGSLGTPPSGLPEFEKPPAETLPAPAPAPAPAPGANALPDRMPEPSRTPEAMPSQTVQPAVDTPGSMGQSNQGPSPM